MDDKEFLALLEKNDCIEELIKMAENPWQKQVVVEFVKMGKRQDAQDQRYTHEMTIVKRIMWGIFSVTAIALVAQLFTSIL